MRVALALLLCLAPALQSCGVAPYVKAAEAAIDLRSARAQVEDQRLQVRLREAILENQSFGGLSISPHVYMERGFLVGFVESTGQADQVLEAGRGVEGLRSVEGYLPVKPATDGTAADLELKAAVKEQIALNPMLPTTRYTIEALDGTVVLLGVVESPAEREAVAQAAQNASGTKQVRDFLLVIEPGFGSLRPHLR